MRTCPDTSQALAETTCSKNQVSGSRRWMAKNCRISLLGVRVLSGSCKQKGSEKLLASYKFSYWKQIFHHWYDCWLLIILIILYSVLSSASQHPIAMEFTLVAWEYTHCRAIIQSRLKPIASSSNSCGIVTWSHIGHLDIHILTPYTSINYKHLGYATMNSRPSHTCVCIYIYVHLNINLAHGCLRNACGTL